MLKISSILATIFFLVFGILPIPTPLATEKKPVFLDNPCYRKSILAGAWYPKSAEQLSNTIDLFLERASKHKLEGKITAIIVPHAGYRYSGQVAAFAYKNLVNGRFKKVILIGPSHRVSLQGISINLQKGYITPLGVVPVDIPLAKTILNSDPVFHWIKRAHDLEHSLEIQLPFLQKVLGDFSIVPILIGEQTYEICSKLGRILAPIVRHSHDTILVASSDLSHYHSYQRAKELDSKFISYVSNLDPEGLYRCLQNGSCEACGGGCVIAVMLACRLAGAKRPVILRHANSGDVTGNHSNVVGYMAGAIVRPFGKGLRPQ